MQGAGAGEEWMGVRAFTRALSAALGREVAASTVSRAVRDGRIPSRAGGVGPEIPLARGLAAYGANTDPTKALGPAIRDGRAFDLSGIGAPVAPLAPLAPLAPSAPAASRAPAGDVNRIKTAQAAIQLQQAQLDLAERQGLVAEVEPLKAAFARQIAAFAGQVEVALPDLAQRLATLVGCEPHAIQVELRNWYRDVRDAMARTARAQGEALPDLVPAGDLKVDEHAPSDEEAA